MTKAVIVQCADDVVDQLNARQGAWSQAFTAERKYQPKFELEEVGELVCQVLMAAWRIAPDNRLEWENEYDIDVGFMYRADPKAGDQPNAKYDELLLLVQQVSDYFEQNRTTISNCPITAISFPNGPYVAQHIESKNQFTSVIRLTFWKLRDPE